MHYPYAEEVLEYADRQGLLVIDETPAVGLHLSLGNMGDHGARTFTPEAIGPRAAMAHLAAIREPEFGADALPGLHGLPPAVWSED